MQIETTKVLDPTNEKEPGQRARSKRPGSLEGLTIGLLDISKPRGDRFLDEVERQLADRGLKSIRYTKPTYARPAPLSLRQQVAGECDVVIEALAD